MSPVWSHLGSAHEGSAAVPRLLHDRGAVMKQATLFDVPPVRCPICRHPVSRVECDHGACWTCTQLAMTASPCYITPSAKKENTR